MKRITLIAALCAVSVFAAADNLRSQINSMNSKVAKVMVKKDIDGFVKAVKGGCTSDFKYTENGRSMNFDEMVAGMRQGLAMLNKVKKADSKIVTLTEKGNSATCTTSHNMVGVIMDGNKKPHDMGFLGTSIETYRKENGKWKMASMTWKEQKMTMDGKPMEALGGGAK